MKSKSYNLSNTDKVVNVTALILIIYLILYGYMSDTATIYAAFISVGGAILAAVGTVYLTKLKENEEKKKHILNTKVGLRIILKEVFLKVINIELNHYNNYLLFLIHNKLYEDVNDRGILKSNLFNSFPEQDVLKMCLYYKLPYHDFYGTINTYYQLNDISLSNVNKHFYKQIQKIKIEDNLNHVTNELGYFNIYPKIQHARFNHINAIKEVIKSFETYKKDTEHLIKLLEK